MKISEEARKELFQKLVRDANIDKEYFRDIKFLFPEMFEDTKPERVKKVFEISVMGYYKDLEDICLEKVNLCLKSEKRFSNRISVKELNCSKQELIEKVNNIGKDNLGLLTLNEVTNLINSHVCEGGWSDEDMIEFAEFINQEYRGENCLELFKAKKLNYKKEKLKGK